MRCEISQNAMSLLPRLRGNRRPMVWAEDEDRDSRQATAIGTGAPSATATKASAIAPDEQPDQPELGPIREPHERVGGERAQEQRDRGAGEADDDGVDVRAQGVVAQLDQDVAPGVERRLEVDEREVERPLSTSYGVLNDVTISQ